MSEGTDAVAPESPVAAVLEALSAEGLLAPQSLDRFVDLIDRFEKFVAAGHQVADLREVTPEMAAEFIDSPTSDSAASLSVRHSRRSALRMLFRVARDLGLADGDPTLDLDLPTRQKGVFRSLTDDEVGLCRLVSVASLEETRLPAAWALVEASARTSELSQITGSDLDLDAGRVWLAGATRVTARWGHLTPWGRTQLARRVTALGDLARPLTYDGNGSAQSRQAAACVAITATLTRVGLADDPAIRPLSVTAWAGQQVLTESGRIEDVARRLGMRSLDRTANLIGHDWSGTTPVQAHDC